MVRFGSDIVPDWSYGVQTICRFATKPMGRVSATRTRTTRGRGRAVEALYGERVFERALYNPRAGWHGIVRRPDNPRGGWIAGEDL